MSDEVCWLQYPPRDLTCPTLCVKAFQDGQDLSWEDILKQCPTADPCTSLLWPDGSCQTAEDRCGSADLHVRVAGLNRCKETAESDLLTPSESLCQCVDQADLTYQVCPGKRLSARAEHWSSSWEIVPPLNETLNECTKTLRSLVTLPEADNTPLIVSGSSSVDLGFLQCPLIDASSDEAGAGLKILFVSLAAFTSCMVAVFTLRKAWCSRRFRKAGAVVPQSQADALDSGDPTIALCQAEESMQLKGLKKSCFGSIALCCMYIFGGLQLMGLFVQVLDAYGFFGAAYCPNQTQTCLNKLNGDTDTHWRLGWTCGAHCLFHAGPLQTRSQKYPYDNLADGDRYYLVFFLMSWLFTSYLFACFLILRPMIRAHFFMDCKLDEADAVAVTQKREKPFFVEPRGSGCLNRIVGFFAGRQLTYGWMTRTCRVYQDSDGVRYFDHFSERYTWCSPHGTFVRAETQTRLLLIDLAFRGRELKGTPQSIRQKRINIIGPNRVKIPTPTLARCIFQECSSFYAVYQMMCILVWMEFYYWIAALFVMLAATSASVLRANSIRCSARRVYKLAHIDEIVTILDDSGQAMSIRSSQLTTGDLVRLVPQQTVPADMAVVTGTCLVNESSLTGEPTAMAKEALEDTMATLDYAEHHNSILLCGTTIVTASHGAYGVVLATGPHTEKGRLLKRALHPTRLIFHFEEEWNVVFVILFIWAMVSVVVGAALVHWQVEGWFYGVFTISQVLSPMIPAVFVAGQAYPARELEKKEVHCANLQRIQVAGRVNHVCFDKTGTLTEATMQMACLILLEAHGLSTVANFGELARHEDLKWSLRACHDLHPNGPLMAQGGDVDEAIFRFARGKLDVNEGYLIARGLGEAAAGWRILRRFPFSRSTLSSGVICQPLSGSQLGLVKFFVKGAVEAVEQMCLWPDQNARHNILERASICAQQGLYVMMIAVKDIRDLTESAENLRREDLSTNMKFLSLLVFRNAVLSNSSETIERLKAGGCTITMLTGDALTTAGSVARAIAIIDKPVINLDTSFASNGEIREDTKNEVIARLRDGEAQVIMSGRVLEYLTAICPLDELKQLVLGCRVFGRVSADQKSQVVRLIMSERVTAMVGDGANDARALEVAHCGIAVGTDAETATNREAGSVAHICCEGRGISNVETILLEGRASLASTSTAYRFLIIYGEIMVMLSAIEMFLHIVPAEAYFIFVDVAINCTMVWAILQTRPSKKLILRRPTCHLLGIQTVLSTVAQIVSNWAAMITGMILLMRSDFFKCREFHTIDVDHAAWWTKGDNYEAAVLGLIATWQWASVAPVINLGNRLRQRWLKSWRVNIPSFIFVLITAYILLSSGTQLSCLFRTNCGDATLLTHWAENQIWDAVVPYPPVNSTLSFVPEGCPCDSQLGNSTTCENEYARGCPATVFNQRYHHNILPRKFRHVLLILAAANFALNILLELLITKVIAPSSTN